MCIFFFFTKKKKVVELMVFSFILVVVKKPRLLLKLPRTYHLCLSWSQGLLACGTLLGHIVVWDIFRSLHFQTPMIHIQIPEADRSSVRNISWVSQLGQRFILSIDIAGSVYTHDLNDPYFGHQVMRLRSACAPLVVFNNNPPSFFFGDNDGDSRLNTSIIIKQSMSVALSDFGHIWSLSFCQSCETIASSSSTGTVMTKSCANCVGQFRKKKERVKFKQNVFYLSHVIFLGKWGLAIST